MAIEGEEKSMKKIVLTFAALVVCMLLQACGPTATPSPPPTATHTAAPTLTATLLPPPATPPLIDMLPWLMSYSFAPAPADFITMVQSGEVTAPIAGADLPEGFLFTKVRSSSSSYHGGELYSWSATYLFPIDDVVLDENNVSVRIYAFSDETARGGYFESMANHQQAFLQRIGGYDVLSYYSHRMTGHMWVSGPYTLTLSSYLPADGTPNAWLTIFSTLLVEMYPPERN